MLLSSQFLIRNDPISIPSLQPLIGYHCVTELVLIGSDFLSAYAFKFERCKMLSQKTLIEYHPIYVRHFRAYRQILEINKTPLLSALFKGIFSPFNSLFLKNSVFILSFQIHSLTLHAGRVHTHLYVLFTSLR